MEKNKEFEFVSLSEMAKMLGISRVAVFKRIKKGQIPAERIGRFYIISRSVAETIAGGKDVEGMTEQKKEIIERAVKKAVSEYGQTLRLLGNE
jgi:excisionase family DNA binding protein